MTVQRVLIVEDEQHLADGLRFNLEAEGYDAEVVDTGEAALERLLGRRTAAFDLVVLDVMLPGIDGFAVVAELRAARQFVPVLMLTARGRPEDVLNGFAAGADDYLPKPFELAILLARVGGLLRRSAVAAAARTDRVHVRGQDDRLRAARAARRRARAAADADGGEPAALSRRSTRAAPCRARRCSRRCGACARTPTRARSTTSSCGCGATSRRSRRSPRHLLTVRGVGYRFVAEPGGSTLVAVFADLVGQEQRTNLNWDRCRSSSRPRAVVAAASSAPAAAPERRV